MSDEFQPWQPWAYIAWMYDEQGDITPLIVRAYAATLEDCRRTMRLIGCLATASGQPRDVRIIENDETGEP